MNLTKNLLLTALALLPCFPAFSTGRHNKNVDVFIGTSYTGHTFPGACYPFGMVQAGPETGNYGWDYCSGYRYDDDYIIGFAQDHINGSGSADLGDILLFPFAGEAPLQYKSHYDKSNQKAHPGYYRVLLDDSKVDAQITAAAHTAFYDFKYHSEDAHLLVNLQNGVVKSEERLRSHVLASSLSMNDDTTISGSLKTSHWTERQVFFVIKFNSPYVVDSTLAPLKGEKAPKMVLSFPSVKKGASLKVKVSLSTVSVDGAAMSMRKEIPDWDFKSAYEKADRAWEDIMSRVDVEGSANNKTMFYTSLYRACIQPNNIADTDGRYRGSDDSVRLSSTGRHYSTLSLWDTFRAAHPLYTILVPEIVENLVSTMLDFCDVQGSLPIWSLWGKETYGMIANHCVPVVTEACLKGFGVDKTRAFEAIKKTLTVPHRKSDWNVYLKYGYYPYDLVEVESVSRTLESCYDDWCAAQLAKSLGLEADYKEFLRRSQFWRNVFDPSRGLVRGKDSSGEWRTPYDPFRIGHFSSGGDFTEGNAWQYTFQVMHTPEDLIDAIGGRDKFCQKLDSLFTLDTVSENNTGPTVDVTGLIGQYAHGNEVCHHVAYLYALAGQPWKTQSLVREVFDKFYISKPDGLSGNDDCGQMSAWYIFSALGFYPLSPASCEYVLGAPQVRKAVLRLRDGKTFTVEAKGLSSANKYVKSVTLNGKPFKSLKIRHEEIMNGGRLVFEMTDSPVI